MDKQVEYQQILENLLVISKAKYGALTLLNESTGKLTTVAVAGTPDKLQEVTKILGFELLGKEWNENYAGNEPLKGQIVSRFTSLTELAGRVLPEIVSKSIEKHLHIGEVTVTAVIVNHQVLGDFTLIMPAGKHMENETLLEIYSRQIELFMTRISAEAKLKASEEKYRTVADFTFDWEAWRAPGGRCLYVSPSCERISGRTVSEFMTDPHLMVQIAHPDDQSKVREHYQAENDGDQLQDMEFDFRIITLKGEVRWISHSCTAVVAEDGQFLGRRESNRDISGPKQTEESLRMHQIELEMQNVELRRMHVKLVTEQARYFDLYDLAPVGYVTVNEKGLILEANLTAAGLLNVARSELVEKPFTRFILKEDADNYFLRCKQLFKTGEPQDFDLRMVKKNEMARFVWVHLIATRTQNAEGVTMVRIAISDITEGKEAERTFRESEEKHRLITQMQQGVAVYEIILDEGGKPVDYRFLEVNPSYERLTGLKRENIIGKTALEIMPDIEREQIKKYGQVAMTGEPHQFETYAKELGKHFEVVAYSPQPKQVAVIISDITERRLAEDALSAARWRLEGIIAGAQVGTWEWNIQTGETVFNEIWAKIVGYTLDELAPISIKTWEMLAHPDDMKKSDEFLERHFTGEFPYYDYECRMKHKDGHWVWVHDRGCVITRTDDGKPLMMFGTHSDITERKQTEDLLKRGEQRLRNVIEGTNAGTWDWNVQTGETSFDEESAAILGYTLDELHPVRFETWMGMKHPEDMKKSKELLEKHLRGETDYYSAETRMKHKDGHWIWVLGRGKVIEWDENGKPLWIFGTHMDITERKLAEEALHASEEKYRLITEFASDVIWVLNLSSGKFTYISPAVFQLRGFTAEEAMNERFEDSMTPASLARTRESIARSMADFINNPSAPEYYIMEIQQPCKKGDNVWVEVSSKLRYNLKGEIEAVGVARNIEERKKAEQEVLYLSNHDSLTGLYNRRHFDNEIMRLNGDKSSPLTLVMADVNGLKLTNDAFGHQAGDRVLAKVAAILKRECRTEDIVARIGGDEFVLLLPDTDSENADKLINRINSAIANEKIENVILSLSIGSAVRKDKAGDINEVFKQAEDEMYRHKLSESSSMRSKTLDIIMNTLYEKSNREMAHSMRVSQFCEAIATRMNFSQDDVNQVRITGLMHDIGKIGIDEKILNKPQKLNCEDWDEIKRHPEIGYRILSSVNEFSLIAEDVLEHHEKWNGEGYPRGLKGEEISLQARIISVADAYDAMTGERTYSKTLSEAEAIKEIRRCSGTQFAPDIARVFVEEVLGKEWG